MHSLIKKFNFPISSEIDSGSILLRFDLVIDVDPLCTIQYWLGSDMVNYYGSCHI